MENFINWGVTFVTIVSMFFAFRKPPVKDWLIVFFLKGFISFTFNMVFVAYGLISYPVRFLPSIFQSTVVFDLLAYPMLCVFYNQTTYKSNLQGILIQALLYSVPATAFEWWLSEYTQVVKFHDGWSWVYSLLFFLATFLGVRAAMALIRSYSVQAR